MAEDIIKNREFLIYHAAEYIEDIPALTLFQLVELCKSVNLKFKVTLRIKNNYNKV